MKTEFTLKFCIITKSRKNDAYIYGLWKTLNEECDCNFRQYGEISGGKEAWEGKIYA